MRSRENFSELVKKTYELIQESKETREIAEKELKRALKTNNPKYQDAFNANTEVQPNFGGETLR